MDDHYWLRRAIALADLCPPSRTAFSVGAVLVRDDELLAGGYSRQREQHDHAEEVVLRSVPAGDLSRAVLYSSLEPCGRRASRPLPCAELIIGAGIGTVVYAWREPDTFVAPCGAARLRQAGIRVVQLPGLAPCARRANAHLTGGT